MSFCYEQGQPDRKLSTNEEHLAFLQGATREYLEEHTMGVDRGVAIPFVLANKPMISPVAKKNMSKADRYIKRLQRKLARQQKGSNRRAKPSIELRSSC
ncbi:hypothetical protein QJQ08_00130 [Chlamydia suis]|uniref:hypothetical protein n=1 Tax=Chlamydia suis TaxID=83559 RepID=UPI002B3A0074|nr:hypothetical protein [Chlamydia suis]MEB2694230.1 hypothetical protein [Chlamydia suis]